METGWYRIPTSANARWSIGRSNSTLCAVKTAPISIRDEHARDLAEARRPSDVLVRDPVHRGRVGRNRPRRPDEARVAKRLAPVGPEPHDRDRDDLVGGGVRSRRLAVEGRVGKRCGHLRPRANRARADCRVRHHSSLSGRSDGELTKRTIQGRSSTKPAALKSPSKAKASLIRRCRMSAKLVASTNE